MTTQTARRKTDDPGVLRWQEHPVERAEAEHLIRGQAALAAAAQVTASKGEVAATRARLHEILVMHQVGGARQATWTPRAWRSHRLRWAVPQTPRATPRSTPHPERGGRMGHPGAGTGLVHLRPCPLERPAGPARQRQPASGTQHHLSVRAPDRSGHPRGRLAVLEAHSAQATGLLSEWSAPTESPRSALNSRPQRPRASSPPGRSPASRPRASYCAGC